MSFVELGDFNYQHTLENILKEFGQRNRDQSPLSIKHEMQLINSCLEKGFLPGPFDLGGWPRLASLSLALLYLSTDNNIDAQNSNLLKLSGQNYNPKEWLYMEGRPFGIYFDEYYGSVDPFKVVSYLLGKDLGSLTGLNTWPRHKYGSNFDRGKHWGRIMGKLNLVVGQYLETHDLHGIKTSCGPPFRMSCFDGDPYKLLHNDGFLDRYKSWHSDRKTAERKTKQFHLTKEIEGFTQAETNYLAMLLAQAEKHLISLGEGEYFNQQIRQWFQPKEVCLIVGFSKSPN